MTILGETVQFEVFKMAPMHANMIDACLSVDELEECVEYFGMKVIENISEPLVAYNDIDVDGIDEKWFDDLLCMDEHDFNDHIDISNEVYEVSEAGKRAAEAVKERKQEQVSEVPSLELKERPRHLKYVFLGTNETLPVIIASNLTAQQEEILVALLTKHKKAVGWSLHDIVGISSTMCMHGIVLEEGAKPVR